MAAADARRKAELETLYCEYRAAAFAGVPEVSPVELHRWMTAAEAPPGSGGSAPLVVVDVREPAETRTSTLPGALTLAAFTATQADYRQHRVVCYCTIGLRSGQKVAALRNEGFDAINLRTSILGWADAGLPLVDPSGAPTRRVHTYARRWALLPAAYEAVFYDGLKTWLAVKGLGLGLALRNLFTGGAHRAEDDGEVAGLGERTHPALQ